MGMAPFLCREARTKERGHMVAPKTFKIIIFAKQKNKSSELRLNVNIFFQRRVPGKIQ